MVQSVANSETFTDFQIFSQENRASEKKLKVKKKVTYFYSEDEKISYIILIN